MRQLLPLGFVAGASAWSAPHGAAGLGDLAHTVLARDCGICRYCGDPRPVAPAPLPTDGDHQNFSPDTVATACLHCQALHRLACDTIDREAVLIWSPEVSQPALNWLVRAIHRTFVAHGEAPCLGLQPAIDTPRLRAAYRIYTDLERRSDEAQRRIRTTSPRELGAALLELSGSRRIVPDGIRLLHLGRHFQGGRDIYPALIEATMEASQP